MEKYRRVVDQSKRDNIFPEASHIVRVNVSGKLTNYITYAQNRLSDEGPEGGKVELVAIGRAINRAVTVAEILRRNMAGLHQLTVLRSVCTRDTYVPIEEGLKVRNARPLCDPIARARTRLTRERDGGRADTGIGPHLILHLNTASDERGRIGHTRRRLRATHRRAGTHTDLTTGDRGDGSR